MSLNKFQDFELNTDKIFKEKRTKENGFFQVSSFETLAAPSVNYSMSFEITPLTKQRMLIKKACTTFEYYAGGANPIINFAHCFTITNAIGSNPITTLPSNFFSNAGGVSALGRSFYIIRSIGDLSPFDCDIVLNQGQTYEFHVNSRYRAWSVTDQIAVTCSVWYEMMDYI